MEPEEEIERLRNLMSETLAVLRKEKNAYQASAMRDMLKLMGRRLASLERLVHLKRKIQLEQQ